MKRFMVSAAAAVVAAVALSGCSAMNTTQHEDCVVLSKERLLQDGTSGEKRVNTSCGTFEVGDSIVGGFNSYDTWTQLAEGQTWDFVTGGFRIGILSTFPVVTGAERVS